MRPQIFKDRGLTNDPIPSNLRKLESWLAERRWTLTWSRNHDDHANFTDQVIVINSNRTPQSQIFGIMHETGHIILTESPDYHARFPNSDEFKHRHERKRETLRVRTEVLGEEWEAWCLGEALARSLGLEIDYGAYQDARNRDLKSYAGWVLE